MVSGLCEAYHWTLDYARTLTMNQMIMLNHASHISRKRSDIRYEAKRKREEAGGGNKPNTVSRADNAPDFSNMDSLSIVAHVNGPPGFWK